MGPLAGGTCEEGGCDMATPTVRGTGSILQDDALPGQPSGCERAVRRRHRAVFVSDVHLGTRGTQAGRFLRFMKAVSCDHLYLVRDVIHFRRMRRRWHWDGTHGEILAELLAIRARGTLVTY